MSILANRYLNLGLRLLLAGMFLFAAWEKILHPQQFAIAVRSYQIVPVPVSNLFALCLAWSEGIAGLFLLFGTYPRRAAGAIFILLVMFIAALTTVLVRGMVIDCGCFGEGHSSAVSPWLIVRNVLLLAAAWIVIRYNDGFLCVRPERRAAAAA